MVPADHITMRNFILLLALIYRCSQSSALLLAAWESSRRTPCSNGLCLSPVWPVTNWVLPFSCTLAMVPRRPHRVRHPVLDYTERANHKKVMLGRLSPEKPVQTITSFSASPFKNILVAHNCGARNSITKIDMAKAEGWTQTAAVPSGEKQSIIPHTNLCLSFEIHSMNPTRRQISASPHLSGSS